MPLVHGSRVGGYEVVAPLGAGGMGEVYRARDTRLDRSVALKILPESFANDPARLMRFEREAKTLAALNHPHIAQLHGFEQSGGTPALVMEFVDGEDLSQRIARGPIPIDEALPIAMQIAEALEAAHEAGIVHRDLKPGNIKIKDDGTVKVLDFGLAKALDQGSGAGDQAPRHLANSPTITSPAMTQAGVILGTAAYMSPEQAKGKSVDKRADIWAFGVVVHEMLTGRRLFAADDLSETLAAVLTRDLNKAALPQSVPAPIRVLLHECLVRDPRQRLRDIGDARLAIQHVLSDPRDDGPSSAMAPRAPARVPWLVAAVSAVAAALLGFAQLTRVASETARVHLSLDIPATTEGGFFLLSPDGRSMTMTTDAISGISVRSLDTGETRALPGTEGRSLFWSPDSQSIGFMLNGALKVVSASGGPPQTLCNGQGANAGAAWSANGTIVFSTLAGGFYRVPAAGGECTPLMSHEACGGNCAYPTFLPDGEHFLYVNTGTDESRSGLYVASFAEPVGRRLLADRSSAIFVPDTPGASTGRLVFVRQQTLTAQPFDAAALRLSGQPETVANNVGFTVDTGRIAASADNHGTLLFLRNATRDKRLVWYDRSGVEREEVAALVPHGGVVAPDGKRVAFTRFDAAGAASVLWTRDLERNQDVRVSNGNAPVWAADGRRLVYGTVAALVVKNIDSEAEEALVAGQQIWASDWSRDNRWLVYSQMDQATQSDIWLLADPSRPSPERRPQPYLRTPASESHAQISPDGRWIAYTSEAQVYLRPFAGASLSPTNWSLSGSSMTAFEPRWRGDSKELFFLSGTRGVGRKTLMSVPISPSAMPPTGVPKPLFEFESATSVIQQNRFLYSPTADGQRFLTAVFTKAYQPSLEMIRNWPASRAVGR